MKKMNFTIPNFARNWLVLLAVLLATFNLNQAKAQCVLAMDDRVDVSLNAECKADLTADMFLTDAGVGCPDADHFEIAILTQAGDTIVPKAEDPTVDLADIELGEVYMVIVWAVNAAGDDINSAMGEVSFVDKLAPAIDCPGGRKEVAIVCFEEPAYTPPKPTALVDCTGDTWVITNEVVTTNDCSAALGLDDDVIRIVEKDYVLVDGAGNTSDVCTVVMTVVALPEGDFTNHDTAKVLDGTFNAAIVFPDDLVKTLDEDKSISCKDAEDAKKGDGTFDPDVTGWPYLYYKDLHATEAEKARGDEIDTFLLDNSCSTMCNLMSTYVDIKVNTCEDCLEKTVRTWTVMQNTCVDHNRTTDVKIQTIEVTDNIAPDITCPEDRVIATNTFGGFDPASNGGVDCGAMFTFPVPEMYDSCRNHVVWTISVENQYGSPVLFVDTAETRKPVSRILPYGENTVTYTAYDQCGNKTACDWKVTVEDKTPPVAVCQQFTTVSLSYDGTAVVAADKFDSGSYDDCQLDSIKVRRMDSLVVCNDLELKDGNFSDYVRFCCSDIPNNNIVVVMRAYGKGGYNDCMVQVEVQDKLPGDIIECVPSVCVPCDYPFEIDDLSRFFGTVVVGADKRKTTKIESDTFVYPYDKILKDCEVPGAIEDRKKSMNILDGYALDNCSTSLKLEEIDDRDQCNTGNIYREFYIEEGGKKVDSCTQVIHFYNPKPFNKDKKDIVWPEDVTIEGCPNSTAAYHPDITGYPTYDQGSCALVGVTYKDYLYTFNDGNFEIEGICAKVIRKWTVMDWCQEEDGEYLTWTYDQVIMISDTEGPEFTTSCVEKSVCTYSADCSGGKIELTMSAKDKNECTLEDELSWRYRIDLHNDGSFDIDSKDFLGAKSVIKGGTVAVDPDRVYPVGHHRIVWYVWDRCGNIEVCDTYFNVNNCKKPTPVCIDHIVVEMMPSDINNDGKVDWAMIEVGPQWVEHCCVGSSHPCSDDLTYSFSEDPDDNSRVYYCGLDTIHDNWYPVDPIVGNLTEVRMYVTAHLPDGSTTTDYCVTNIDFQDNNNACDPALLPLVQLSGSITNINNEPVSDVSVELQGSEMAPANTSSNGTYEFEIDANRNYIVAPEKDDIDLRGITTLDIVLIQKHILGLKKIDNPYKLLAANVSGDDKLTSTDVLILRKLILAKITDMGDAWMFVNKGYQFDNARKPYGENVMTTTPVNASEDVVVDFYGIKMGDINLSLDMTEARSSENLRLAVDAVEFESGVVEVPVYAENMSNVEGFQYTFKFDADVLSFEGVESGKLTISEENVGATRAANGLVAMSWNSTKATSVASDEALFTLKFNAKSNANLKNVLSVSSDIAKKEAYNSALEVMDVNLQYRGEDVEFVLYQNTPNPFSEYTDINFTLPNSSECTISIYDLTGKVVKVISREFEKGSNSVRVSKNELNVSGVLYYVLETGEFTATKKMVILK